MVTFTKPTVGFSRGQDNHGSGQFNASRGNRSHQGLDIIATPGEMVKSPIKGILTREARPYANDPTYKGVVIKGTGDFEGLEIKMFYVVGLKSGPVNQGETIGIAQDISQKYQGITNHIHLEVRRKGIVVSPTEFYNSCF